MALRATSEEIAVLLSIDPEDSIVERLVDSGASIDEIVEALADLEQERQACGVRLPSRDIIGEVRHILEELPSPLLDGGPVEASSGEFVEDEIELHREDHDDREIRH